MGGAGNDILIGGRGNDVLSGSTGTNTFKFLEMSGTSADFGKDIIVDFQLKDGTPSRSITRCFQTRGAAGGDRR